MALDFAVTSALRNPVASSNDRGGLRRSWGRTGAKFLVELSKSMPQIMTGETADTVAHRPCRDLRITPHREHAIVKRLRTHTHGLEDSLSFSVRGLVATAPSTG